MDNYTVEYHNICDIALDKIESWCKNCQIY